MRVPIQRSATTQRSATGAKLLAFLVLVSLVAACGAEAAAPTVPIGGQPEVLLEGPRVLFLGDSLSAGLHLPSNEAFPAILAQLLAAEDLPIELVNAGVSGDTTAGGLARLDWLLAQDPDLMVVELGANDGLRGVSLKSIESNLRAIVSRVQDRGIPVLLLGMKLPPNYGLAYTSEFAELFARVAADTNVAFVPFFLEPVAANPELNLPDGLHPNTEGHRLVAADLLPVLRALVEDLDWQSAR